MGTNTILKFQAIEAARLGRVKGELAQVNEQIAAELIDGAAGRASERYGVASVAVDDVMRRVRAAFHVEAGRAVATAGGPATVEDFVAELAYTAAHLFARSAGGGSSSVMPGPGGGAAVLRSDTRAFVANVDGIAAGKVRVI